MKAIVVPQPYAWLLANGQCDIINQIWPTDFTGQVLIYASSKNLTRKKWLFVRSILMKKPAGGNNLALPPHDQLMSGGVQGYATITGCVKSNDSHWFKGPYGLTISEAGVVPFQKARCKNGCIFESTFELETIDKKNILIDK